MIPLLVVDEFQSGAETLGHMHLIAVVGVFFCYLRRDEFLSGNLKTLHETRDSLA